MPKQLNINLGFTADTNQARQQIQQLKQSLQELNAGTIKNSPFSQMSSEVMKAQQSVQKLSSILDSSLNMNTGRLDLSKFNQQLGAAGMSVQSLATDMSALGADGQKAFLNLANSIVTTQKPMVETNRLLDGMWTALKNTARWQLSSSLLHGFIGAIQGAYGYAQDLDKSLTNIAIVTGKSRDEMASFAEQANKSAQALSASTTAYTDAALIYYQQGLDDAEVKARTDVTMMMANVTGESAEHVSSYMTAIWNNFAEGSDNLEHFADVITALGAHTAASSEEIAKGMQQFAAVADTVGLSYEYAATALATVVAQTRQSESTVGNSFRTIFSRLQGLKLGETLEDGTDLNKYSEALAKVGVDIKDQNGELKDMDSILDEIAGKWQQLSKDQQVALAQTVGGVRQYTNLIALFDNWDKFQENLDVANHATGELAEQNERYEESWLAAQKRVKAAWQAIYQDLIDSNAFIVLLNTLEKLLKGIDLFIDGVGGIPGVLSAIGVAITGIFGDKILAGIQNAQQQLKVMSGVARQEADYIVGQTKASLDKLIPLGSEDSADAMRVQSLKDQVDLNYRLKGAIEDLAASNKHLTESQQEHLNSLIETTQQYGETAAKAREYQEAASLDAAKARSNLRNKLLDSGIKEPTKDEQYGSLLNGAYQEQIGAIAKMKNAEEASKAIDDLTQEIYEYRDGVKVTAQDVNDFIRTQVELSKRNTQANNSLKNYNTQLKVTEIQIEAEKRAVQENISIQEAQKQVIEENIQKTEETLNALTAKTEKTDNDTRAITENTAALETLRNMQSQLETAPTKNFNIGIYSPEFAQNLANTITTVSRVTMAFNSLKSAIDTLNNPDLSIWEKFTRVTMSLGMALPILITQGHALFASYVKAASGMTLAEVAAVKNEIATRKQTLAAMEDWAAKALESGAITEVEFATCKETFAKEANSIATKEATIANLGFAGALKFVGVELTNLIVKSLKFLATPIGIALMSLGLIATGVAMGFKEMQENSPEGQLERISQEAEEAHQQLDEVKQKYDDLNSSLQSYKDLQKSMNEMDEVDRARAIAEQNEELRELILNTKDWQSIFKEGIQYDDSGLIKITESQMEQLKWSILEEESAARRLALEKDIAETIADQKVKDKQSGAKKITTTETKYYEGSGGSTAGTEGGYYSTQVDVSGQVADALAKANIFDLNAAKEEDIKAALEAEGLDPSLVSQIMDIKANSEETEKWEALIADHSSYLENLDAQKEANARELIGQKNLEEVSDIEQVREAFVQNFADLTSEEQQKIVDLMNQGNGLVDAWQKAGIQSKSVADIITESQQKMQEDSAKKLSENTGFSEEDINSLSSNARYASLILKMDTDDLGGFKSPEELQEYLDKLEEGHDIPVHINTEDLTHFKGKAEDLEKEVQDLADYIQDNAGEIEGLSEHLKYCRKEAEKVAYAMIRFDDAVQDVTENYDDWNKVLKEGKKNTTGMVKTTNELKKTYGNLLDIDGSQLSSDFLESTKNLEDMKLAIEGNEEAYDRLRSAVSVDYLKEALDLSPEEAQATVDTINNSMDAIEEALGRPLEAGENIDFESLGGKAYEAQQALEGQFNSLLAKLGNDVTAAQQLMSQMGYDAEFEEVTEPITNTTEVTDIDPEVTDGPTATVSAIMPGPNGGLDVQPIKAPSQGFHVKATTHSETAQSEQTVTALKIKPGTLHKSVGGGVKMNNSRGGGGGSKGGGCFAAGTLITLQNKYKNIEDIKVGDIVLSYNEKTKKNVFNKVLQRMVHIVKEKIYSLFIRDEELTVTGIHRFLITRNNKQEWIQASELQEGDLVLLANGTLEKISNINIEEKPLTVYNFEVSNTHNYYVGENQILAHNKGGGGGKGSSKKAKVEKPKEKKQNIKEEDRYHNIKEKIEDLNKVMDRLNKNKDRAYGKDRIKYMDLELQKTQEQIDLTKKYIKEIKDYQKVDKNNLKKALGKGWKDINTGKMVGGLGLSDKEIKDAFDENGVLKNYEGLLEKMQNKFDQEVTKRYNKAIDTYNAAVTKFNKDQDEEAFEKAKEALEKEEEYYQKQEEYYKQQVEYLKQYEDTMNLLQEKQAEWTDQVNEQLDKALEKTKELVQQQLDLDSDARDHLAWVYDNLGDSADRAADRIANLGQQSKTALKDIEANSSGMRNALKEVATAAGIKVDAELDIFDPKQMADKLAEIQDALNKKAKKDGMWDPATLNLDETMNVMTEWVNNLRDAQTSIREMNDEIIENMTNAIDEWSEKMDENLEKTDSLQSLIDVYKEIGELLGNEAMGLDPEVMKAWDQTMLETKRDAAEIAQQNYIATQGMRRVAEEEYVKAMQEGDELKIKMAKENLDKLMEQEEAYRLEWLERYRDTLQQAQEIYEKALEENEKTYKKTLGGGLAPNLDKLQEQLETQKKINNLHLDDYEKYKKLGDLQANINKQLAKNPNVKTQGKLRDLLDDVNDRMAAGAEISEGEATILEKRLALLQAEDQLMAARNAKSAVRMTRDNEGNFSYTYTADTSKIEEAQQNYADKFYDLLDYERQYSDETQAAILDSYQEFLNKRNDIINDETLTKSEKEALLDQLEKDSKAIIDFYAKEMEMVTGEMGRLKDKDWKDMEEFLKRPLAEDNDFEDTFKKTTLGQLAPEIKNTTDIVNKFVDAAGALIKGDLGALANLEAANEESTNRMGMTVEEFGKTMSTLQKDVGLASDNAVKMANALDKTLIPQLEDLYKTADNSFYNDMSAKFANITTNIESVSKSVLTLKSLLKGLNADDINLAASLGIDLGYDGAIQEKDKYTTSNEAGITGEVGLAPAISSVAAQYATEGSIKADEKISKKIADYLAQFSQMTAIDYKSLLNYGNRTNISGGTNTVINANFPNVSSYLEIAMAIDNLSNSASQYTNEDNE